MNHNYFRDYVERNSTYVCLKNKFKNKGESKFRKGFSGERMKDHNFTAVLHLDDNIRPIALEIVHFYFVFEKCMTLSTLL